ncbi:hypothetical protein GSI_11242 [Ganoderma sinense ZZ0214-1]|uniref:Uncharacterized protein n=1 Tax=Ganoderma sinense ZZ0214-1 TaxID=1077348 RepID=A0A2G8RYS0_9APHY|nr:hypothetical protein GSI_11242 [Ganoderma sinense ZZ0214-1]
MLRNGIMYFVVLSMLNILQLVLTLGFHAVPDGLFSYVWYLTFPLPSILVSHFLLDLQEAYQRSLAGLGTEDLSGSQGGASSIEFALGSVGATTDPVADVDHDIEEEDNQAAVAEGIPRSEGEPGDQSRAEYEDGFEILEVPRGGVGEETVGVTVAL